MSRSEQSTERWGKTLEYIGLIFLGITFESVVAIIAKGENLSMLRDPWLLLLLGLASFRGGRALAYNYVFEWLRAPFTEVVDDSSGAGKSIMASGTGFRRVLGELLCCPICAGTWVALVLTGLLVLIYPFGLIFSFILAASGLAELVHWYAERQEWQGRQAREESGTAWLLKNKGTIYPDQQIEIDSAKPDVDHPASYLFSKGSSESDR